MTRTKNTSKPVHCAHCGHPIKVHKHHLNKFLVNSLIKVYKFGGRQPVHLAEAALSANQVANFQKLRYWGLVIPYITEETKRRRGWWVVTEKGQKFLQNKLTVPKIVRTFRIKVTEMEGALVGPNDVVGGWGFRGDYADDVRCLAKAL